jgi:uncharacterized protein (TIGR02996 family)
MNEAEALLQAIALQPADRSLRLVYADWLEEQGDGVNQARARLVRLQETWERHGNCPKLRDSLERRAWGVVRQHPGLLGSLRRVTKDRGCLLASGVGLITFLAAAHLSGDESVLPAGSSWWGYLEQSIFHHPTTVQVTRRAGTLLEAEMAQDFSALLGEGEVGRFSLRGVVAGPLVGLVSGRLSGQVLAPGLYLGQVQEHLVEGTWSVPGSRQNGTFVLERSE